MNILVVACSLDPQSRSYILAQTAVDRLNAHGASVEFRDLREYELPMCDGGACYQDPTVHDFRAAIEKATAVLMAVPIYNYDINAATKNLVELTGRAWTEKIVGFLCAAGGRGSYMSVMGVANDLMLDFRCLIIPRFVYAVGDDFENDRVNSTKIAERIDELCQKTIDLSAAIQAVADRRADESSS